MTPEDLDRYYRHPDTGQHGEDDIDGDRAVLERWAIGGLLIAFWCAVAYFIWGW